MILSDAFCFLQNTERSVDFAWTVDLLFDELEGLLFDLRKGFLSFLVLFGLVIFVQLCLRNVYNVSSVIYSKVPI